MFLLTIGESGERKSAVDDVTGAPHREHEAKLASAYEHELECYEIEKKAWQDAQNELGKKKGSKRERMERYEELGRPPDCPVPPFLLVEEPTYEGLVKLYGEGVPSLGLFSDEGGRFIGGHALNSDNALKTAAGLSDLWGGKAISRVRSGDKRAKYYHRRLSMHLMMQGVVAEELLANRILTQQGLMSRCLLAWPSSTVGTRLYQQQDIYRQPEFIAYRRHLHRILQRPMPINADRRGELSLRSIPLNHEAYQLWVKFHDYVETSMATGGEYEAIRGFAGKAPEHAARIAGVLQLVGNPDTPEIDAAHMVDGIDLAQYYLTEALRLHDMNVTDPNIVLAERLLEWLKCNWVKRPEAAGNIISLPDIYQHGPNAIRDAKTARRIAKVLEEHHHLERLDGWEMPDGKSRKEVWRVR
jgi:hypothetical protein